MAYTGIGVVDDVYTANGNAVGPSFQPSSSSGAVTKLSDDVASPIFPSGGNIQLVGHIKEQGATKFSTIVAGINLANINPMSSARWIVDPLGFNGTHTTISAALASATSGDTIVIMPGTYTGNLTLVSGVNLCGFDFLGGGVGTKIIGTLSDGGSTVNVVITNINLNTNGSYLLNLSAASSSVTLSGCAITVNSNTGINVGSGNTINLFNCSGSLGTNTAAFWTGAGTIITYGCTFNNSGSSTATSSLSGIQSLHNTYLESTLATSGAGQINFYNSISNGSATNVAGINAVGTGGANVYNSLISSGTSAAITVGAGTTVTAANCELQSSNAHAVTGAGTFDYGGLVFTGTATTVSASTVNTYPFNSQQGGTGVNNSGLTITLATGATGRVLISDSSGNATWSSATYPSTTTINQILYSSSANTVAGLATANQAVLTTGATGIPVLTALATNGQLIIGSTAGVPAAATLSAGSGVSITNGSNSITINAVGGGLTWSDNSGTFTAVANNGYFITAASTPTLPSAPNEGDTVAFIVDTASTCTVTGNTGQKIRIGAALSASAGTAANNARGDSLELVYRSTGTTWFSLNAPEGTWTVT